MAVEPASSADSAGEEDSHHDRLDAQNHRGFGNFRVDNDPRWPLGLVYYMADDEKCLSRRWGSRANVSTVDRYISSRVPGDDNLTRAVCE